MWFKVHGELETGQLNLWTFTPRRLQWEWILEAAMIRMVGKVANHPISETMYIPLFVICPTKANVSGLMRPRGWGPLGSLANCFLMGGAGGLGAGGERG